MTGIDTQYRSDAAELMDDFELQGEELRDALDKIAAINRLLGGNKLTLNGVKQLLTQASYKQITIVDVGCGNGDMLRELAKFGIKNNYSFRLVGLDANAYTINHAKSLSVDFPNISYRCEDVFDKEFETLGYDIVLCTLTLHHFEDADILRLLHIFTKNATLGVVVNDLQRSGLAYRLFQALCFVLALNAMSREDGLTSILRGFKKKELERYSGQLNLKKYSIRWKWAFRYQWVISTT